MVIDRFLDYDQFKLIWDSFKYQDFSTVHHHKFEKIYRFDTGNVLCGINSPSYCKSSDKLNEKPIITLDENDPLTPLIQKIFSDTSIDRFTINIPDWNTLKLQYFIYPPGSALGWHSDGNRSAAFIYYAHPQWASQWGGELMIADENDVVSEASIGNSDPFDEFYGGNSFDFDMGTYVQPIPNRLVVLKGRRMHCIKRVELAAGTAFRATISGFFE